jgi:hypothetical protein
MAKTSNSCAPQFGGVYLITIIGAAVYFVSNADGFWGVVLALLKSLVWPAFVVYRALELMNL